MVIGVIAVAAEVVGTNVGIDAGSATGSSLHTAVEGIDIAEARQLAPKCTYIFRLKDVTLRELILHAEVHLFVVRGHDVLVHVPRVGKRRKSRIVEQSTSRERIREQVRLAGLR